MAENGALPGSSEGDLSKDEIVRLREKYLCSANQIFFEKDPLLVVRGKGTCLYDEKGTRYLDCINNVSHVGHSNERVVEAIRKQAAMLNTNNRYLHPTIVQLAERLVETFPAELTRVAFVNSGSEANDLALRMARAHTRNEDIITLDRAYHGHVMSTITVSPYKYDKLGPASQSELVHEAPCPDTYNGKYKLSDEELGDNPDIRNAKYKLREEELGDKYAQDVLQIINGLRQAGRSPAAFISESLQSCGGQILPPAGYLSQVYRHVRAAGGVCIADEVQVGFGRVGTHWWAFQTQGNDVVPDIVTIGKPMGNGHPVAAVVFTEAVNDSFADSGVAYFNTFGGNPVSCAAAMAVMDEIEVNNLMDNCIAVGEELKQAFNALKEKHSLIGDVRVLGMFAGIELVKSRKTRKPATDEAKQLLDKMLERKVLLSADGPHSNVIKFKPPIVFSEENVKELVEKLDDVLTELELGSQ